MLNRQIHGPFGEFSATDPLPTCIRIKLSIHVHVGKTYTHLTTSYVTAPSLRNGIPRCSSPPWVISNPSLSSPTQQTGLDVKTFCKLLDLVTLPISVTINNPYPYRRTKFLIRIHWSRTLESLNHKNDTPINRMMDQKGTKELSLVCLCDTTSQLVSWSNAILFSDFLSFLVRMFCLVVGKMGTLWGWYGVEECM